MQPILENTNLNLTTILLSLTFKPGEAFNYRHAVWIIIIAWILLKYQGIIF